MSAQSQPDSTGLLPCPFCGGSAVIVKIEPHSHAGGIADFMPDHPGSAYVDCGCGVGIIDADEDALTKRWNTRIPDEAVAPPDRNKLAEFYDAEMARVTGLYFDALNEIKALRALPSEAIGREMDVKIDAAYANGVRACLARLYHLRKPEDDAAWNDCEAMWRNRVAERHASQLSRPNGNTP